MNKCIKEEAIFHLKVEIHAKDQRFATYLFRSTFVKVKKENHICAQVQCIVTTLCDTLVCCREWKSVL